MSNYNFVYLCEIKFSTDSPDEPLMDRLEKLAADNGASIKVVDEFYHENKAKS